MELEQITTLVNSILSVLAVLIAWFKKGKSNTKSLEDIEAKAEAKKVKYINKQLKKNGVAAADTKSPASQTTNQSTTTITTLN